MMVIKVFCKITLISLRISLLTSSFRNSILKFFQIQIHSKKHVPSKKKKLILSLLDLSDIWLARWWLRYSQIFSDILRYSQIFSDILEYLTWQVVAFLMEYLPGGGSPDIWLARWWLSWWSTGASTRRWWASWRSTVSSSPLSRSRSTGLNVKICLVCNRYILIKYL